MPTGNLNDQDVQDQEPTQAPEPDQAQAQAPLPVAVAVDANGEESGVENAAESTYTIRWRRRPDSNGVPSPSTLRRSDATSGLRPYSSMQQGGPVGR
jgi:hypothetical protein